jgi:hypothetical protein
MNENASIPVSDTIFYGSPRSGCYTTGIIKMITKNRRSTFALRFAAMMLLICNLQADASTITWAGTHNSNWSTASNWSPGTEPLTNATPYDVIIPATITGGNKSVTDQTGISISLDSLTIQSGQTTGFAITGGSILTLGTGSFAGSPTFSGVSVSTGTLNVTGALTNSTTISAGGSGVVNLNGNVANTGGMLVNSGGTLHVGAASTVTGGTVVGVITNSGTISGATIGGLLAGATVNGGTISGTTSGSFGTFNNVLFSGATLTNGSISGVSTASGADAILGGVAVTSGTLTIVSGTTTIGSGTPSSATLTADSGLLVSSGSGGTLSIASGGDVEAEASFTENAGGIVALSGTLDVSVANLVGGSFDGTGTFEGTGVNNGNGTNGANSDGLELYVGGSAAAWAAASDSGAAGTTGYSFSNYTQDSGGTLGITFNSAMTGNDELSTVTGASINGALDLYSSNGAELNLSSLNTGQDYVLLDNTGGAVSGTFSAVNVIGTLNGPSGWQLVYNGSGAGGAGDVELDFESGASTPEPGTEILLAGALAGLVLLRRKLVKA